MKQSDAKEDREQPCQMTEALFSGFFTEMNWCENRKKSSKTAALFFTKRFWHLFLIQIDGRLEFELQTKPAAWHEFIHLEMIINQTPMDRRIIFWLLIWRSKDTNLSCLRYVILYFSNSIVSFLHSLEKWMIFKFLL